MLLLVPLVAGAALAQPAAAEQRPQPLILPGEGIGPVRLGMTLRQVKRALGSPVAVVRRDKLVSGGEYVELQWAYSRWTVGFRSRSGTRHAVRVATTVDRQRTRAGVGPGSRPRDVLRAFPRASCIHRELGQPWPGTWLVVTEPDGSTTGFSIYGRMDYGDVRPNRFVIEVVVQERWYEPTTVSDCGRNWRREFRRS